MIRERPPSYPVIHVTMRADGSAQLNLAGDHQLFTGSAAEESREQVIAYAVATAERLRRGVRMRLVEEDGTFDLAVYPDGAVQRLDAPTPARKRPGTVPAPQTAIPVSPPAGLTPPLVAAAVVAHAPSPAPPYETFIAAPPELETTTSSRPVGLLRFSTGERRAVRDRVIVGRRGRGTTPTVDGWGRIDFDDPTGTVSRGHAAVQFHGDELWISDLGSANGTQIYRQGAVIDVEKTPIPLRSGDTIALGSRVTAHLTIELQVKA